MANQPSPESILLHYRIISKIGAGGMGEVYLGRIAVDPFMDPLRDDPRFKNLLKRMNLSS